MIRNAASQVGNLIKNMDIDFDDSNLFILKSIPEDLLQNKKFPIVRIDGLPTNEFTYSSNKKNYEEVSCQVNIWANTIKELETYQNLIEKNLSTHSFECFFNTQDFDDEYEVHRLILRVRKNQNVKELF